MSDKPPRMILPADYRRRTLNTGLVAIVLMSLAMAGLVARVVYIQVYPPAQIADRIEHRGTKQSLEARRGSLLDRQGRIISATREGHRLFIDPQQIKDPLNFANQVAQAIGEDPARIDQLIDQAGDRQYVVVEHLMTERQLEAVKGLKLPGLGLSPRAVREYPMGTMAAQLVGTVGFEQHGLEGLERTLDKALDGKAGLIRTVRDASRRAIRVDATGYQEPQDGKPVKLSLDLVIQAKIEEVIERIAVEHRCESAQAVMLQAKTGQVLAMANYPAFDPSDPKAATSAYRRNRCVTDQYEPGSTFKPFMWAKAIEGGFVKPTDHFDTGTSGARRCNSGRVIHDVHAAGTITAEVGLIKSSNILMSMLGERMGAIALYRAMHDFGFGELTGSGLPGEMKGKVNELKAWTSYSITSVTMGQEVAVTPLQMARALTAIANDGLMVSPSVLASEADQPRVKRVLSVEAARETRQTMRRVITEGTGKTYGNSKLYSMWGKTGTAQVPGPHGGYIPDAYTASFMCGAPVNDPQVVLVVVFHRPDRKTGYYGGTVAAPAAKEIIEAVLPYLGVPADNPTDGKAGGPEDVTLAHD